MDVKNQTAQSGDEIRLKGVRAKGYGQIAKMAMLDPDLSIEAKAILAYFCSYCGGGNTAFPGRDKIVHDLHINKDTYYRHLKTLISNGYISVEQRPGDAQHPGFRRNIYTIENFPEKYDSSPADVSRPEGKVKAVRDIYAAGYGIVPKAVMQDDISIQAKGLYAYLCAFSGRDLTAAPSRDVILAHLRISHNSSNKYMQELCSRGYVSKLQSLSGGRFAGFTYYLNQEPETAPLPDEALSLPQPKITDTQISDPEPIISDTPSLPQPIISDTQISDTQKPDANKPSVNMTRKNKKSSVIPSVSQLGTEFGANEPLPNDRPTDFNRDKFEILEEIVSAGALPYRFTDDALLLNAALKVLTDWELRTKESYYQSAEGEKYVRVYKIFISALTEMLTAGSYTTVRGARISHAMVYRQLMDNHFSLNGDSADLDLLPDECVEFCLEMMKKRKISDMNAYMKSIIWTKLKEAGAAIAGLDECGMWN